MKDKLTEAVGVLGAVLVAIAAWVLVTLLDAWCLMLAVGVLHHAWFPAIPPMGYWTAVIITFLLRGVFSPFRSKGIG